eukprot:7386470-Prymnesium_polylepis.2
MPRISLQLRAARGACVSQQPQDGMRAPATRTDRERLSSWVPLARGRTLTLSWSRNHAGTR